MKEIISRWGPPLLAIALVFGVIATLGYTCKPKKGFFDPFLGTRSTYAPNGQKTPGILTHLNLRSKNIGITLDACSGDYDKDLIDFLIAQKVPATLFLAGPWIKKHPEEARQLAANPLFEIGIHGYHHLACTLSDPFVYGAKSTKNENEMRDEIALAGQLVFKLLGIRTKYYRPGTGMADEKCVEVARNLGYQVVGWNINGDWGATASQNRVLKNWLSVSPGSIVISHMNHPESETAKGIALAIPELFKRGYRFVQLSEAMQTAVCQAPENHQDILRPFPEVQLLTDPSLTWW